MFFPKLSFLALVFLTLPLAQASENDGDKPKGVSSECSDALTGGKVVEFPGEYRLFDDGQASLHRKGSMLLLRTAGSVSTYSVLQVDTQIPYGKIPLPETPTDRWLQIHRKASSNGMLGTYMMVPGPRRLFYLDIYTSLVELGDVLNASQDHRDPNILDPNMLSASLHVLLNLKQNLADNIAADFVKRVGTTNPFLAKIVLLQAMRAEFEKLGLTLIVLNGDGVDTITRKSFVPTELLDDTIAPPTPPKPRRWTTTNRPDYTRHYDGAAEALINGNAYNAKTHNGSFHAFIDASQNWDSFVPTLIQTISESSNNSVSLVEISSNEAPVSIQGLARYFRLTRKTASGVETKFIVLAQNGLSIIK